MVVKDIGSQLVASNLSSRKSFSEIQEELVKTVKKTRRQEGNF